MRPFLSLMAIYEIDICAKLNGGAVRQAPLKLCVYTCTMGVIVK